MDTNINDYVLQVLTDGRIDKVLDGETSRVVTSRSSVSNSLWDYDSDKSYSIIIRTYDKHNREYTGDASKLFKGS